MINFDNIKEHIIGVDDFQLKWRLSDEQYDVIPNQHLEQLKPLNRNASKFLADYLLNSTVHSDFPFKKGYFKTTDNAKILKHKEKEIKKWLYQRGLPFDKEVFLSWDNDNAVIAPWELVIKYFDSFYYGGSDDLTIFDESLTWAVLFHHEDEIYFGTNQEFKPMVVFENIDFIF